MLVCHCDARNQHDPFAVATCKVIGHVRSLNNTVYKTFTVLNENKKVALELKFASS